MSLQHCGLVQAGTQNAAEDADKAVDKEEVAVPTEYSIADNGIKSVTKSAEENTEQDAERAAMEATGQPVEHAEEGTGKEAVLDSAGLPPQLNGAEDAAPPDVIGGGVTASGVDISKVNNDPNGIRAVVQEPAESADSSEEEPERRSHHAKRVHEAHEACSPDRDNAEGKPDQPAETILERVTRAWGEHVNADSSLQGVDRLQLSSAYRAWVRTINLGLSDAELAPPFRDVWLAHSGKHDPLVSPSRLRLDKEFHPTQLKPQDTHTVVETLDILCHTLRGIQAEGRTAPFNASLISDRMRQLHRGFRIARTPFGRLSELLKHAEREGWIRLVRWRDDVLVQCTRVPLNSNYGGPPVLTDEKVYRPPAVSSAVYPSGADAFDETSQYKNLSTSGFADADRACDTSDRRVDERRRYGEPPRQEYRCNFGRWKTLQMLDTVLRDIRRAGSRMPITASVVADRMRRAFPHFDIEASPFSRFTDLLLAAESDGLLRTTRHNGDCLVTWIKHAVRRCTPPRRSRRRTRSLTASPRRCRHRRSRSRTCSQRRRKRRRWRRRHESSSPDDCYSSRSSDDSDDDDSSDDDSDSSSPSSPRWQHHRHQRRSRSRGMRRSYSERRRR